MCLSIMVLYSVNFVLKMVLLYIFFKDFVTGVLYILSCIVPFYATQENNVC